MNCLHCGYLLFHLTEQLCPECGQSYALKDYLFERGDVSFHCPHCDQAYYGNDEQGLPYPREFNCVGCKKPLTLHELRVVPCRDGVRGVAAARTPWDDRQHLGLISAWWATFKMTLFKPGQLFARSRSMSNADAYRFALVCNYVGLLPYFLFQALFMFALSALSATAGGAGLGPLGWLIAFYVCLGLVGPLVFPFISAGVNGFFIQIGLLALVPNRKSFGHTYRTALLAQGPMSLMCVPLCGGYVANIWSVVTLIIGIKEVHETTGWRASIAVLWPLVAFFLLIFAVVAVMIFAGNM